MQKDMSTYSKIKCNLRPNSGIVREETCFLIGAEFVGQRSRRGICDPEGAKAQQR